MEKSLDSNKCDIFRQIRERFQVPEVDIRTYSPLTLAYIGDGIYDLVIRSLVVGRGNTKASQLHQHTSHLVKAHSQSAMMEYILPELSEEEEAVYRRGRNAKSPTMAKNATMGDYRRATGFEALMGYLYLEGSFERMLDLIELGLSGLHA
jgi:ribonuclease-3 family protein